MYAEPPAAKIAPVSLRPLDPPRARPDAAAAPVPGNLPRPLTSLIGRDADIAAVLTLLADNGVRLLTLTGPGGVGKTRLALRLGEDAAAAFADGVVFVPLAAVTDPDLVLPTIAWALGLRATGVQSPADLLADSLRDRRSLLVIDNFEQVLPAATHLAALLAACPGLVMLVTSRAPLRISGEQRFPVPPLALPDADGQTARRPNGEPECQVIARSAAVQLFVARAQAVDPRFTLDASNAAPIAAICRRLDGLPLAIELAAARLPLFSPADLYTRLDPVLPLLSDGPEDAPDRLRTMRQAIAWSYELLTEEEQTLFRRLAIFSGGCTLEAAEAVGGEGGRHAEGGAAPPAPLDLVASLIDKSLLRRTGESGDARFVMLETIREFGLEQLTASGETTAITDRHAAWCQNLAEDSRRTGRLSQGRGLAELEAEHPNLRAALSWLLERGETTAALHLAGLLAEFWFRRGHLTDGQMWLERALAAEDGEASAARAEALVGLNMLLWPRNELARAEGLLGEAETVARAAGDAGALAYTRLHQGYVALQRGDLDLAEARGAEALETGEAIPQGFVFNAVLWLLARAALARKEDTRAADLYERLLASARASGDETSLANGLYGQAILAERNGEPGRMLAGLAEAAAVCRGYGDRVFGSHCLEVAAATAVALGRSEPAVRLFAAAEALRSEIGATPAVAYGLERQGLEQALMAARTALGAQRFSADWAAGAALSFDEAIAEAVALADQETPPDPGHPRTGADILTGREREILRLLVAGWPDKEIAARFGIGRRTVSNHVATIRAKLDAPSRSAAVAVRDHLV